MKKNLLFVSALSLLTLVGCTARGASSSTNGGNSSTNPQASTETSDNTKNSTTTPSTPVKDGIRVAYAHLMNESGSTNNIVRAEVNVKDGKATNVRFDEVALRLSDLTVSSAKEAGDNVTGVTTGEGDSAKTTYYINHLYFMGKTYNYIAADDGTHSYKTSDGKELLAAMRAMTTQKEFADLYYAAVNNAIYAVDAEGKKVDGLLPRLMSKANYNSTYWTYAFKGDSIEGSRWKWNIDLIQKSLIGKDLSKVTATADDKTAVGATITSYADYVKLAQDAFKGTSNIAVAFGEDTLSQETAATYEKDAKAHTGHGNCIAKGEVIFDSSKKVTAAYFNETDQFLTLAATLPTDSNLSTDNVLSITTGEGDAQKTTKYAKYINVNGMTWTAAKRENASGVSAREKLIFSSGSNTDALTYYSASEEAAQTYYNAVFSHHVNVADSTGKILADATRGNTTATKAEYGNGYWVGYKNSAGALLENVDGSRWKWNINQLQDALVGKDLTNLTVARDASIKTDSNSLVWDFNGTSTGASMNEAPFFVELAKLAQTHLA